MKFEIGKQTEETVSEINAVGDALAVFKWASAIKAGSQGSKWEVGRVLVD